MICAGIGCKSNVTAEEVLAAIDSALGQHGLTRHVLGALATVAQKQDEPALHEAAQRCGLPLAVAGESALKNVAAHCLTSSRASLRATNTASASEAAALAVCGAQSRLLGSRLVLGNVTCAIAILKEDMA